MAELTKEEVAESLIQRSKDRIELFQTEIVEILTQGWFSKRDSDHIATKFQEIAVEEGRINALLAVNSGKEWQYSAPLIRLKKESRMVDGRIVNVGPHYTLKDNTKVSGKAAPCTVCGEDDVVAWGASREQCKELLEKHGPDKVITIPCNMTRHASGKECVSEESK